MNGSSSKEAAVAGGSGAWDAMTADDPSDWKGDFAALRSLDASLRCDLCFDIYTAPVAVKECSHTFCSSCIRSAINKPGEDMGGRCPKCMGKNVYDSTLLPQPTLELAAQHWKTARPFLFKQMELAVQAASASSSTSTSARISGGSHGESRKRARGSPSPTNDTPPRRRSTRRLSARQSKYTDDAVVIDSSEEEEESDHQDNHSDEDVADGQAGKRKDYRSMEANDLVQCPTCMHTFTIRMLNVHLDKGTCKAGDPEPTPAERGLSSTPKLPPQSSNNGSPKSFFRSTPTGTTKTMVKKSSQAPMPRRRLVRLNYDLCKPNDIKRSLDECNLPTTGERKRLIERHRKWVNLYNANMDASEKMRKSDAALRQELNAWERSLGATANLTEKRVKTWTMDHKDEFARLAEQARSTHLRDRNKHDDASEVVTQTDSNGATSVSTLQDAEVCTQSDGIQVDAVSGQVAENALR